MPYGIAHLVSAQSVWCTPFLCQCVVHTIPLSVCGAHHSSVSVHIGASSHSLSTTVLGLCLRVSVHKSNTNSTQQTIYTHVVFNIVGQSTFKWLRTCVVHAVQLALSLE